MIIFHVKELMENKDMSRYKLKNITGWNYRRINAFFFNNVKLVTMEELEKLCEIFACDLHDLLELKK